MKICSPQVSVQVTSCSFYLGKDRSSDCFNNQTNIKNHSYRFLNAIIYHSFFILKEKTKGLLISAFLFLKNNGSVLKANTTYTLKLGTEFLSIPLFLKRIHKDSFNAAVSYINLYILTNNINISKKLLCPNTMVLGFQTLNTTS
ncbi:hypothetical protein OD91_1417 [Lutibacter sp. Hel_I_33_5]|nr:hypothetical protein OD91_1417 [Lutibacter sp. Hel_I_33_5]